MIITLKDIKDAITRKRMQDITFFALRPYITKEKDIVKSPLTLATNSRFGSSDDPDDREEAFVKKLIAIAGLLVLVSAASAQNWFKGTLDQAVAKAKNENKLVLVDFYSSG